MTITLERLDDAFHLRATNENGNTVETDASPVIGGSNLAMRPMEMLLASLGSCSTIDVLHLLKKFRQPVKDIKVTINGEREKDKNPALFTDIHLVFTVYGDVDPEIAQKAVNMSLEKYCSVAKILEKTATLTWESNIAQ